MDKELKFFLYTLSVRLDVIIGMLSKISSKTGNGKELNKKMCSFIYEELEKIKEKIDEGE